VTGDPILIEHARRDDLPVILAILNHYVQTDHCIFDTEPWSVEQKLRWFEGFTTTGPYQLLVARDGDALLGYAHSSR